MNIIDKQTVIISVALFGLFGATNPSQVQVPMNLRFAADELIVKSISYNNNTSLNADISQTVQIWCDKTNDGLIGSFPNSVNASYHHDEHFRLNSTFQTGNVLLQFLQSDTGTPATLFAAANPATVNPQQLISLTTVQETFGTVVITVEFVKLKNKEIY